MSEARARSKSKDKIGQGLIKRPNDLAPPLAAGTDRELLALQRSAGNSAVRQLLERATDSSEENVEPGSGSLQNAAGGLSVGRPGDTFEREADRVADHLLDMPEPQPESRSSNGNGKGKEAAADDRTAPSGSSGGPLRGDLRSFFETRLGADLSGVRIHTDGEAAGSAQAMNARALTVGSDVAFGPGQYAPETRGGLHLLAHEMTHVAQQSSRAQTGGTGLVSQQSAAPQVQGSFFGDVWEGIKSVGSAVGGAVTSAAGWLADRAKDIGRFVKGAADWVGERLRDASMWVVNLIRDMPERLARLASTIWDGLVGVVTFLPEAIQALASGGLSGLASWFWEKAKRGGAWVLTFLSRVFDVIGGPELLEFVMHLITKARPLRPDEIIAASQVLGPSAIRWGDVRVSEGGILALVFALNNDRAFTTWHTINLPENEEMKVVVHELTHVYQYEKAGTLYLGQAIHAQATVGYEYDGAAGLVDDKNHGKHFRDYNREQQGQIAQDYYELVIENGGASLSTDERAAYDFFIGELKAGDL